MEPEIVNQNQRQYSLDNLLLGESPEAEHGDEPDCEGDFFRLSAQEWQNRTLMPLKEDLAMWISELLDVEITCQDFFEKLQDGIILCKLAKHITDQEIEWKGASSSTPFKAPINTRSGPFFSRENITHFLRWCKALKINDTCLFEPSDLLLLRHLKNIIVCLYAIARRFKSLPNLKLPNLIQLEDELDNFLEHEVSRSSLLGSPDVRSEHCISSSTSSCSPKSGLDESDCFLTQSLGETPDRRRFKPCGTPKTQRRSRIPRYSPNQALSTSKSNLAGSCSDISEHESNMIRNSSRGRKSSIPVLALDKRRGSNGNTPSKNEVQKRSKSVDYKKKIFLNSMTIKNQKFLNDSCDSLDSTPRKDLRRTKFCKPGCSPQSRCCLKQEVEPRRKRQRDDNYVIMDLDDEVVT